MVGGQKRTWVFQHVCCVPLRPPASKAAGTPFHTSMASQSSLELCESLRICFVILKVKVAKSSNSLRPQRLYCPWNSQGWNTGVGSLSLLQGIFPTQGSNPRLLHCRWILYQLSHKGSPRILEWVAHPFSRGSSQPRNRTQVFRIAAKFEFLDTPPIF